MRLLFRKLKFLSACAVMLLALTGTARAQAPATDGAVKPGVLVDVPRASPRAILYALPPDRLYSQSNRVETSALDTAKLLREDTEADFGPLRMGVVQDFVLRSSIKDGQWTALPNGGWLWTISFTAPGAQGIRLRAHPWNPPLGAELVVYNPKKPTESAGPFTRAFPTRLEEFWTPTIYSDQVNLEYYLPPEVDHRSLNSQLTVDGLLNQYRSVFGNASILPCHLDVTCYPAWSFEANGVGALSYVGNPFGFFCSGAMLNRSPADFTPVYMTARHCGVNDANVTSLLITWFYQTPSCSGTPPDPSTLPQTLGCVLLANDASADYTLVGLLDNVPGGVTFEGWDAGYWANASASTGISHPAGSFKRICFGSKVADEVSCVGGSSWHIVMPNGNGEIEPGSSGSPVFDAAHRVRGTASCANWDCSTANDAIYGRFDVAFGLLGPYLLPTDPVYVNGAFVGTENGTVTNPFNRFKEGVFAVRAGSNLYIEIGSYNEPLTLGKAMTLNSRNGAAIIGQ